MLAMAAIALAAIVVGNNDGNSGGGVIGHGIMAGNISC